MRKIKIRIDFTWEVNADEIDDDKLRELVQSIGVKSDTAEKLIDADIVSIGLSEIIH